MKTIHILVWLALALLAQTTLVPLVAGGGAPVDLVLIVVVFAALNRGPVAGLWTGTLAGLLQDALSGGVIGVSGLTKTIIGVLAGLAGSRFILGTVWHRLAVLAGASFVHAFCYLGIYALIGPDGPAGPVGIVVIQAAVNALIGAVVPLVASAAPGLSVRFRQSRNPMRRRRWTTS
jgi:rod shape-determining protein MreD